METIVKSIIFIISPFIYGIAFIISSADVTFNFWKLKRFSKKHFKPFWLETNEIFQAVKTREEFLEVYLKFKKAYPDFNFLDLKINKFDYSLHNQTHSNKDGLISFGLRSEHIHDIDYTLEDYFLS
jgi:hypothetical protein